MPVVTLTLSLTSISEADGTSVVTASLDHPSSGATTVTVMAEAVSPAVGGDFSQSGATLTIEAGETESTGQVTVMAVDNDVDAPDKVIEVSGMATNTRGTIDPAMVALMIEDDDAMPVVTLALSLTSISEADGTSTVTARLSHPSSESTTVTVTTEAVSPAVEGDFIQSGTTLTIEGGQTESTGQVTVTAVDNDVDAPDKVIEVSGMAANTRGTIDPAMVALMIEDDEVASIRATLSLSPDTVAEGAGATRVTVTADLDAAASAMATELAVSVGGGTATEGMDYAAVTALILTIERGQSRGNASFTFRPISDSTDEPDETLQVSATADGGLIVEPPGGVALTIEDDDAMPMVTLALSLASISEAGGTSTVTASLDHPSSEATTVTVTTEAVSPAVGGDFIQSGTTLTIEAGEIESTGQVTVMAVNNDVDAPDKIIEVSGVATNPQGTTDPAMVALTITDDDAEPVVTLALSLTSISEADETSTVTARLSHPSSESTTVTVTTEAVSPAVGGDFSQSGTTLTIEAGETESRGQVTVTAVNNNVDAPDKIIEVSGMATNTRGTIDPAMVALMIEDDDAMPVVTLALSLTSISEVDGTSTVTVSLDHPSSEATTVTVTTEAVPPAVQGDFSQSGTMLTIEAGETESTGQVTVTAVNNDVDAPDKVIEVSGVAANPQGTTGPAVVMLTIEDDDAMPTVTLALSLTSISEADGRAW